MSDLVDRDDSMYLNDADPLASSPAEPEEHAVRAAPSPRDANTSRIEELRRSIDEVDMDLLRALAARMSLVNEIGERKRAGALAPFQANRWSEVLRTRLSAGTSLGLNEPFVLALFELIHDEAVNIQSAIVESEREAENER